VEPNRARTITFSSMDFRSNDIFSNFDIDGHSQQFCLHSDVSFDGMDQELLYDLSANLGLSYLIDLMVICLPEQVVVETIDLTEEQAAFWQKSADDIIILRLYEEKRPPVTVDWSFHSNRKLQARERPERDHGKMVISVGGGKESLAMLKLIPAERISAVSHIFLLMTLVLPMKRGSCSLRRHRDSGWIVCWRTILHHPG